MGTTALATGLSVTLCLVLLVVLVATALLLYRQCKRNREQKRLREERMRRRELEDAFLPVPSISSSVTQSMTSLYDNTDDTALVAASHRDPHLHVYDNRPITYLDEESVRVSIVRDPGASVGGRRAQRVSYSKNGIPPTQNGHVTSSGAGMLPVGQSAYQNAETGYGSLGSETLRYSCGIQQASNPGYGAVTHVTQPPPVTSRGISSYPNGGVQNNMSYSSHNTEV